MNQLQSKTAFVTGAASGIGESIARHVIAAGGSVVGGDLDVEGLAALQEDLGPAFTPLKVDVTQEDEVGLLAETAIDVYGGLQLAFNVAGAAHFAYLSEMSEDAWDYTVNLCLKGVFFGMKHAARLMLAENQQGAIVNVASINAVVPQLGAGSYCAAKAGVVALTRVGAIEVGPSGIRVNSISPGLTETPGVQTLLERPGIRSAYLERIPLGRPATVDDVAAAAVFLGSDAARYITGTDLLIDGGWSQTGYPDLRPHFRQSPDEI